METTTTQSTPTATDAAINAATDKIIESTCARHNIQVADLPPGAVEEARRAATEMIQSEARKESNEYYHLYNQEKKARETAEAQLGAVRENREAKADTRTVESMEQVRERVGRAMWFQFSESQKLTALGLDPATVDKNQLRSLFGAKSDGAYAVDFMKTSPYRYRQLKQAALALNITGK